MVWRVKYHDLETRNAGLPFWKQYADVEAESRKEAIAKLKAAFSPPKYGNYTASPAPEGAAASCWFR